MNRAESVAGFVTRLQYADLPPQVVRAARRHLLDTIGVAFRGSAAAMPQVAFEAIRAMPSTAGAVTVWGHPERLSAPFAAMVNGVSAHVLDFDDTHSEGIVHGSAILAPLVLAVGQDINSSGRDLIVAFVAGWEVAARVGLAAKGTIHQRGYHTTSVAGVFGAAAAAAKLMNLDESRTLNAIALAGSMAAGINEYQSDGSSSKIVHTGWTAHAGTIAAQLAKAGMTGPGSIFEGRLGFLNAYGDIKRSDIERLDRALGTEWEVTRVSIKPYPCCHFGHAFIDCAAALRAQGIHPADIENIECVVPEIEVAMVCEPLASKRLPSSPYSAKFSLPFMVALGLVDGEVGATSFTDDNIRRPELLDIARRVSYRVAAPGETTFPRYFPGWVNVTLKNGTVKTERMDINWGTPERPMDDEAVKRKFIQNTGAADIKDAEALAQTVLSTEQHSARAICEEIALLSRR